MNPSAPRPPAVGFVFVTMLLAVVGFGLIYPVLPGLITEFEGGDLAGASHQYGWLVGAFAVAQFVGAPVMGALSDRFGRRRVILVGTAGGAVDYVIMACAPDIGWLFVARIIAGFTAGIVAAANAYLIDVTPPERRAQSFGLLGAAFGLGFVIGPALGGVLGAIDLRLPFWVAAGCAAANCVYGYLVLPESLPPENRRAFSWRRANPVASLLGLRRHPVLRGLAWTHLIGWTAQAMLHSTWAFYTGYRYDWGPRQVGLSLGLVGVCSVIVQAGLIKHLVGRLGEVRAVTTGHAILIAAFLAYGLAPVGWMIYAIIVAGSLAGMTGPALQTYISRHVPADEQGLVQGAFTSLTSVAAVIGQPVAAWSFAWAVAPGSAIHLPGIAFFEGAALLAVALAVVTRTFRRATAAETQTV